MTQTIVLLKISRWSHVFSSSTTTSLTLALSSSATVPDTSSFSLLLLMVAGSRAAARLATVGGRPEPSEWGGEGRGSSDRGQPFFFVDLKVYLSQNTRQRGKVAAAFCFFITTCRSDEHARSSCATQIKPRLRNKMSGCCQSRCECGLRELPKHHKENIAQFKFNDSFRSTQD